MWFMISGGAKWYFHLLPYANLLTIVHAGAWEGEGKWGRKPMILFGALQLDGLHNAKSFNKWLTMFQLIFAKWALQRRLRFVSKKLLCKVLVHLSRGDQWKEVDGGSKLRVSTFVPIQAECDTSGSSKYKEFEKTSNEQQYLNLNISVNGKLKCGNALRLGCPRCHAKYLNLDMYVAHKRALLASMWSKYLDLVI